MEETGMGMQQRKVSIKDIANEMNCAVSTVSKALTNKPGVSEKRRQEIREVAQKMGYEVNSVAQIMSRNPITIGVVVPVPKGSMALNYTKSMRLGMEKEFSQLRKYRIRASFYMVPSVDVSNDAGRFLQWIDTEKVEAVCFCPNSITMSGALIQCIIDRDIPLFLSGGGMELPEQCITMISIDAYLSGKIVADFLHCIYDRDIHAVVLTGSVKESIMRKKATAFQARLQEYGVDELIVLENAGNREVTVKELETLLDNHPEINAIYALDGDSTLFAAEILKLGNRFKKITLVGTDLFEEIKHYITDDVIKATLMQSQQEVGRKIIRCAYDYLIRKRTYGNEEWQPQKRIYLKPQLCLRANLEEE